MAGDAKITITWVPPYGVRADFPEDPILCAFLLAQARKIIDKRFDDPDTRIQPATSLPGTGSNEGR